MSKEDECQIINRKEFFEKMFRRLLLNVIDCWTGILRAQVNFLMFPEIRGVFPDSTQPTNSNNKSIHICSTCSKEKKLCHGVALHEPDSVSSFQACWLNESVNGQAFTHGKGSGKHCFLDVEPFHKINIATINLSALLRPQCKCFPSQQKITNSNSALSEVRTLWC